MSFASELSAVFRRDIIRFTQEIEAFPEELIWETRPGVGNSAGTLTLHLEGNLRHYIGFLLGGVAYTRQRPLEFSTRGVSKDELLERIRPLQDLVPTVIAGLSEDTLSINHTAPEFSTMPNRQVLLSLYGHLSYHTGQVDYLRRVLSGNGAITLAGLTP